jgi:hypothetical protein
MRLSFRERAKKSLNLNEQVGRALVFARRDVGIYDILRMKATRFFRNMRYESFAILYTQYESFAILTSMNDPAWAYM